MMLIQEYASKISHEINNHYSNNKTFMGTKKGELRINLDENVSISLIYNDKLKRWILTAERDVTSMTQNEKNQLLERLMDTASHSRYAEYLVVGVTESKKISVSKNVVDVSVNQAIINTIERIVTVVMSSKQIDMVDNSSVMHC